MSRVTTGHSSPAVRLSSLRCRTAKGRGSASSPIHEAGTRQRVEEQVEVDNARVGMPARHQPVDGVVVQWGVDPEQAPELVVRADVVSGKDVQTAQAAE